MRLLDFRALLASPTLRPRICSELDSSESVQVWISTQKTGVRIPLLPPSVSDHWRHLLDHKKVTLNYKCPRGQGPYVLVSILKLSSLDDPQLSSVETIPSVAAMPSKPGRWSLSASHCSCSLLYGTVMTCPTTEATSLWKWWYIGVIECTCKLWWQYLARPEKF